MEPIVLPPRDYEILVLEFPPEVKVIGNLLGSIEELKYVDHDLTDAVKFPSFKPENYLKSEHDGEVTTPVGWTEIIYKSIILNAL